MILSQRADFVKQVPWIPSRCRPREDATIVQIDSDPLKKDMGLFYIDAVARFQAHPVKSIQALAAFIQENFNVPIASDAHAARWERLVKDHKARGNKIITQAYPTEDDSISPAYLFNRLTVACPADTVWVVEAVTNAVKAADQIQATIPGSWVNCGGGGLGWSGGGALGVKLALDA